MPSLTVDILEVQGGNSRPARSTNNDGMNGNVADAPASPQAPLLAMSAATAASTNAKSRTQRIVVTLTSTTFLKHWSPVVVGVAITVIGLIAGFSGLRITTLPSPTLWDGDVRGAFPQSYTSSTITWIILAVVTWVVDSAIFTRLCPKALAADVRHWVSMGILTVLAMLSQIIGQEVALNSAGVTYELWSIILGFILINVMVFLKWATSTVVDGEQRPLPFLDSVVKNLNGLASQGEQLIKPALVLLSIEIQQLLDVHALVVGWVPTTILFCGCVALVLLLSRGKDNEQRRLLVIIVAGTCICGASAIAAVSTTLKFKTPQMQAMAITVVSLMTIFQTVGLPHLGLLLNRNLDVIGSWLGGVINSTGCVVAAASILGNANALRIAQTVKIIQNILIAPICLGIVMTMSDLIEPDEGDAERDESVYLLNLPLQSFPAVANSQTTTVNAIEQPARHLNAKKYLKILWNNFPKFVIGLLINSVILSIILAATDDSSPVTTTAVMISKGASALYFAKGFVGIGLAVNAEEMRHKLKEGVKMVLVPYVLVQLLNIFSKYGFSVLCYGVWKP